MVGAFIGTMPWTVDVAVGTLVGGTIPFDVALEGAAVAFVAFVVGSGLVFRIPNAGDLVVMG